MTNEEAITKLTNIMHDDHYSWPPTILAAFNMAVDALKGAGGDLISRKEAIDRIESHLRTGDELYPLTDTDKVLNCGFEIAASCVYNLPSAQPTHNNTPNTLKSLDCIERQAAIDVMCELMHHWFGGDPKDEIREIKRELEKLPSAHPSFPQRHENDCISRMDAIDAVRENESENYITINNLIDKDVVVALLEALPSAQPEQRWISVSERLPEEDEQVLVYLYDSPYIAWIDSNGEWNTEDFTLDKEEDRENEPIAWMPLPEPWKEGEADAVD